MRIHHELAVRLFGVSPTDVAVIGRDGSLFYAADDIIQTRRKPRRGPAETAALARRTADGIAKRWGSLRARGIRYVLLIAPDRASVHRDQLPAHFVRGPSHLDLMLETLPAEVRPDVIDLRGELLRQRAVEEVYYRTDTHWNVAGARVALRKLVQTLGGPPEAAPAFPDFPKVADTCGLGRAIGLPSLFPEACYHDPTNYPFEQHRDCSFAILERDAGGRLQRIAAKCRSGRQRALVLRDSFLVPLVGTVAELFAETTIVGGASFDPSALAANPPDIVVQEIVERSLPMLGDTSFLKED
jgi:hypothetical protein